MTRVRTNVYLDEDLKAQAKILFKEYGISLSNGVNLLLSQIVNNKKLPMIEGLDIEAILEHEDDYKLIQSTKDDDTISIDEFMKL